MSPKGEDNTLDPNEYPTSFGGVMKLKLTNLATGVCTSERGTLWKNVDGVMYPFYADEENDGK